MYPLFFLIIALCLAVWGITRHQAPPYAELLNATVFCNIGLQGIYAFIGHTLKADEVADKIGWPRGSPFQTEIAFANLAFGVMGSLVYLSPHAADLAAVLLGRTIFIYGAVYTHLRDYIARRNNSIFNTGPLIYFSIGLPILWWSLFCLET